MQVSMQANPGSPLAPQLESRCPSGLPAPNPCPCAPAASLSPTQATSECVNVCQRKQILATHSTDRVQTSCGRSHSHATPGTPAPTPPPLPPLPRHPRYPSSHATYTTPAPTPALLPCHPRYHTTPGTPARTPPPVPPLPRHLRSHVHSPTPLPLPAPAQMYQCRKFSYTAPHINTNVLVPRAAPPHPRAFPAPPRSHVST
eukprot:jgi/Botrbrau1/9520/Bobra.0211s0011.1